MSKFIKHLLCFWGLGAFLLLGSSTLMAQDLSEYQLVSVRSDHFFYNFEYQDQTLLMGTDGGIYIYRSPLDLDLLDPNMRGYLALEKGVLTTSNHLIGDVYAPHYKDLLPEGFRHDFILGTVFQSSILLISKGQLFVFKKTLKPLADTLSVRTLSQSYLGTYKGIFYKGKKLDYPNYTNGYIREFEAETFICYDGLLRIQGADTTRYESSMGFTQIGKDEVGKVKDIFKIDSMRYLLFSEKGLSLTDLRTGVQWIERSSGELEPRFVKAFYRDNLPVNIYFILGNKIQKFNVLDNSSTTFLEIASNLGNIKDAYFPSLSPIYLLTDNTLLQALIKRAGADYSVKVLAENLLGNHHIIPLTNQLLVTSNDGLSSYNLDTREWIPHLLRDEFNHRAIRVTNDSLYLGTIHGYYQIAKNQIEELITTRKEEIKNEVPVKEENPQKLVIYTLIAVCVLLVSILIFLLSRTKKPSLDQKVKAKEILDYIDAHLNEVTIVNICYHFKINPLQLNEILGDYKPGELIRKKRLDLVRKMRRDHRKEEEIAQVSGFSISYLKKIKT